MVNDKIKIPLIYVVSITMSAALCLFLYAQISGVQSLTDDWTNSSKTHLANAHQLAKIERELGYVGFIHHFKNYIIRGDGVYLERALASYELTSKALEEMKSLSLEENDLELIKTLEDTINEYHKMLLLAERKSAGMRVNELDRLVKVDDTAAEEALLTLRSEILPSLENSRFKLAERATELNQFTMMAASILLPLFLFSTYFMVTVLRNLFASNIELESILDSTPDGIMFTDSRGNIRRSNSSAADIFGYTHEEFQRLKLEHLLPPEYREAHKTERLNFLRGIDSRKMGSRETKIVGLKKDGRLVPLEISIVSKVINKQKSGICVIRDMSRISLLEEEAREDPLTHTHNRRQFGETLIKELERHRREAEPLSIFMIDLDEFKAINDTCGHTSGDEALVALAEYLRSQSREYDHIARWGGDEFVLLCPNMKKEDAIKHGERIRIAAKQLEFSDHKAISLSIGIATVEPASIDISPKSFLELADKAVYVVKSSGRDAVKHYDFL